MEEMTQYSNKFIQDFSQMKKTLKFEVICDIFLGGVDLSSMRRTVYALYPTTVPLGFSNHVIDR
jgi:hypothetical protein